MFRMGGGRLSTVGDGSRGSIGVLGPAGLRAASMIESDTGGWKQGWRGTGRHGGLAGGW